MQTLAFPTHCLLQLRRLTTSITPLPFSTLTPCRFAFTRVWLRAPGTAGAVPGVNVKGFPKSYVEMFRAIVGLCGILLWLLFVLFYLPKLKWMLQGVEEHSFFGQRNAFSGRQLPVLVVVHYDSGCMALICNRTFGPVIIEEPWGFVGPHPNTSEPILMSVINSTCDVSCFPPCSPRVPPVESGLSESLL